ncbi:MAG: hypothetical protein QOI89_3037, partial [Solirubrobacteraceae bacterium]|nr:hypothetical protein [Solirubrobacteraceae bacterium]
MLIAMTFVLLVVALLSRVFRWPQWVTAVLGTLTVVCFTPHNLLPIIPLIITAGALLYVLVSTVSPVNEPDSR